MRTLDDTRAPVVGRAAPRGRSSRGGWPRWRPTRCRSTTTSSRRSSTGSSTPRRSPLQPSAAARWPARAPRPLPTPSRRARPILGFGPQRRVSPEWAAWANGVAVRELDFHDTFLAAEYSHPGDNIPPVVAVAQHCGLTGGDVARGIATGYEIQIDLARGICLHEHKIDHIAHLGPSAAAGIGTALGLPAETIFQAIQQALHVTTTTRQSRKGEISSWKALRAGLRREDGRRGRGPGDARRGRPVADLRGRGRRHRLAARRAAGRVRGAAARARARPSGRSSTPTPRSTQPSTRPRR